MFLKIRDHINDDQKGFTLIELLVVVIIIGILAAIAIPTFLRQRERAWDAASESELRNAAIAMESYATGNNGSYAGVDLSELADEGFNLSPNFDPAGDGDFTIDSADAAGYCMTAAHANQPTVVYVLDSAVGAPEVGTC